MVHLFSFPRPSHARLRASTLGLALVASLMGPGGVAAAPTVDGSRPPDAGAFVRSPRHVHQKEENCVWAAGAMLIDKWTHGRIRVTQGRLRAASGDKEGGSSLADLSRGVARATGLRLRTSPGWGDSMRWWQLLDRLENGGGAVLVGSYASLPAAFTRWDPVFARKAETSHAVYVERYERARGRVWLMDPLATWNFPGEWIDVEDLRRYATMSNGYVVAAATPARRRPTTAPLIDRAYRLGSTGIARTVVAGSSVSIRIPVKARDDFPAPDAQRIVARWVPLGDAALAPARGDVDPAGTAADIPPGSPAGTTAAFGSADAPGTATGPVVSTSRPVRAAAGAFTGIVRAPTAPGRYLVTVGFKPVRGRSRRVVRSLRAVVVEVVPSYAARISVPHLPPLTAGQRFVATVGLANIGEIEWTEPSDPARPSIELSGPARLVATWRNEADGVEAAGDTTVDLPPGGTANVKIHLTAPIRPGIWTLDLVVVSPNFGPTTAFGGTPGSVLVRVRASALRPSN